jgi:serine protease Do
MMMLFKKIWFWLLILGLAVAYWLYPRAEEPVFNPPPAAKLEQLMQGAFVAARPAMLQLRSLQVSKDDRFYYSRTGRASGFLISKDGFAVTAYHAVVGIDKLEVLTTKQELLPARVIGFDESRDLAIIKVQAVRPLEFLSLETDQEAKINDPIVEVGNSGNDFIQPRYGAIQGYIQNEDLLVPTRLMLSNVNVNPGDSGGAVLNFAGNVIGVGIGYSQDAKSRISYLVPLFGLRPWLLQMQNGAKLELPGIGIRVSQSEKMQGLDVDLIKKGSVLQRAGFKLDPHDQTRLLELDGQALKTLRDYHRVLRQKKIGDSVQIKLWYEKQEKTLTLKLE